MEENLAGNDSGESVRLKKSEESLTSGESGGLGFYKMLSNRNSTPRYGVGLTRWAGSSPQSYHCCLVFEGCAAFEKFTAKIG